VEPTLIDFDQHLCESQDAFTRYLDPKFSRVIQWAEVRGRKQLLVGEKVQHAGIHPAHERTPKPGTMRNYFRGGNPEGRSPREIMGEPEPPPVEYFDRARRVEVLDSQGIATSLINPQTALVIEEALFEAPAALYAVFDAYHRWMDEDWGFARADNRIICPPPVSLIDPVLAEKQLQWLLEHNVKVIMLRPGPVVGPWGSRTPADGTYDRFWSMVEEAGVVTAFHVADVNSTKYADQWGDGEVVNFANLFNKFSSILSLQMERPAMDTIASLIAHGLFDRHPNLKVATIELGSGWVPELLRRLKIVYGQMPQAFAHDPVEQFHENVWVTPFQEENMARLVSVMRPERILFGSDWPHPEGVAEPSHLLSEFASLSDYTQQRITHDNAKELLALA
jgi:predicted TIM-barrel fold metal-dependent hydrolase